MKIQFFLETLSFEKKVLCGWLHIIEFALLIFCIEIIIFYHIIVIKNPIIIALHCNMKMFLHHMFVVVYTQQLARFTLFLSIFLGFYQGNNKFLVVT